jgi:exopolyphosphatase/guanosine-5'-triphosphate,3'-diphosphate pyrophosphatase
VLGTPGSDPTFHVSTSAGSVRQTERHLTDDPPTDEQLSAVAGEVAAIIEAELPRDVRREAATGIAVAGTATQLAAVDQRLEQYDPERVHGYRLDRYAVEEILEHLARSRSPSAARSSASAPRALPRSSRRAYPGRGDAGLRLRLG